MSAAGLPAPSKIERAKALGAFALLLGVALAGCGGGTRSDPDASSSREPAETPSPAPNDGAGSAADTGETDLFPATLTPEAEKTEKGARNVLLSWGRAIELREFDQAWRMMGEAGADRWAPGQFREMFADLDSLSVALPDGRMEGAAGSSYYSLDIAITAQDADGRPVRIEGPVVLRRVNDVPGSSDEARRWHFESIDLSVTH